MPIFKSSHFKYEFDEDGNFYWHWKVPDEMFFLDPNFFFDPFDPFTRPRVRAMIQGYQNGEVSHEMWIDLPYLMSGVFVPASSEFFDITFERVEIGIYVQINDFSNRAYSKWKKVKIK